MLEEGYWDLREKHTQKIKSKRARFICHAVYTLLFVGRNRKNFKNKPERGRRADKQIKTQN